MAAVAALAWACDPGADPADTGTDPAVEDPANPGDLDPGQEPGEPHQEGEEAPPPLDEDELDDDLEDDEVD